MSPVTWDETPLPPHAQFDLDTSQLKAVDPTAAGAVDPADFGEGLGEGFGEGDGERTTITTSSYDLKPKFTGRASSIKQLQDLVDRAFKPGGHAAIAVVVGEPGMGKSRILAELVARAKATHPSVLVLSGIADERAAAYGPIARALTARFGVAIGEAPETSREKIVAGVGEVVPAARVPEIAHLVAHLLRVPFDDSPIVTPLLESAQRLEARLWLALKRLFTAEAEARPLLIAVENLELCETDTINFLQYLAAGMRDQHVAIVGTATPALWTRHHTFGEGEVAPARIELGALGPAEAEELLRELCKQLAQDVPPKLVWHVRGMGSTPRAIHELVRYLLESDVIVREGVMWRLDAQKLATATLPKTYDELVAARLRVMEPVQRRVVEMAAVVGESSWLDAILSLERLAQAMQVPDPDGPTLGQIAASGDHSRLAVVDAANRLIEREWLVEIPQSSIAGERELRFAYPNLWQQVYKGIDDARRRAYHAVVARWIELHPEGRSPAAQEDVGRHLALAGETRDAATRYRRAAEAARAVYQNEKAIRLFDKALACVGSQDLATRLHLWHDLGSVYELIGDFESALGAFERMLRLSWVAASKTKAAVAFNKMGRVWRRKGDLRLALEYLERGHELFRGAGDQRGVASSLDDIGRVLHMLGRYDEAHAKITEALARRGQHGDERAIATSLSRLGDIQADRGQFEAAYTCHKDALELRIKAGDRWGKIVSQNNLAALAFELGDGAQARTGWLAALGEAESIGALPLAALVLTNLGELALTDGKLEEARRRLEAALEIIDDTEDRGLESEACRHTATLEQLAGHTKAAREYAERALEVAKSAGLREQEARAYLTLGDVLSTSLYDTSQSQGGLVVDAAHAYAQAIDVLRTIGNEAGLGKALFAFGRYKAETGDVADGKDLLRDAIAVFAKLGLARPATDAEKLLATLH